MQAPENGAIRLLELKCSYRRKVKDSDKANGWFQHLQDNTFQFIFQNNSSFPPLSIKSNLK